MGIRFSKEGEGEKSKFKALHDALHERSNGNGAPPPLRSSAARLPVRGLRRTRAASFRPPASARSSPWLSPGGAPRRGGSRRARASGTLESERRRAERQRQREAEG